MFTKKQNWLLILAGFLFCLYFSLNIFVPGITDEFFYQRKNSSFISSDLELWLDLALGIIILPIIEEITNRGFLIKNKKIKILFFIVFCIEIFYLKITYSLIMKSLFILLGIYIFFADDIKYFKNTKLLPSRIILSSILFSIAHTPSLDISFITLAVSLSYYLAIALLFCWVVINYSLLKSILIHIFLNALVILFIEELPFSNSTLQIKKYPKNNTEVIWRERSFFSKDLSQLQYLENGYNMENVFPYEATKTLVKNQDSLTNHIPTKENTKYDIKITSNIEITDSLYFSIMRDIGVFEKKKFFKKEKNNNCNKIAP